MLFCENVFCLYNKDGGCMQSCVCIDAMGRCDSCILAQLSPAILEKDKEKQRKQVEQALDEFERLCAQNR